MEKQIKRKTPEERFKYIAPKRVNKILKSIESLSKCSTRNYSYSEEQVKKMFRAIKTELRLAEDKFKSNGKSKSRFKF